LFSIASLMSLTFFFFPFTPHPPTMAVCHLFSSLSSQDLALLPAGTDAT
jgi:hypothetical protein